MVAFERNLQWQELFDLALSTQTPDENLVEIAYRVAEDLSSKKRHAEAGRVLLDYAKDIKEAVSAFSTGNDFSEARRVVSLWALVQHCLLKADLRLDKLLQEAGAFGRDHSSCCARESCADLGGLERDEGTTPEAEEQDQGAQDTEGRRAGRVLRNGRCGHAKYRCNDRRLDGSDDIYQIHRCTLDSRFKNHKVSRSPISTQACY
jgi:hypothetical protein